VCFAWTSHPPHHPLFGKNWLHWWRLLPSPDGIFFIINDDNHPNPDLTVTSKEWGTVDPLVSAIFI
jgi:hypothetical protein